MKFKKIFRPEIEVEYVGIKGFFSALLAICKVGLIKKSHIDYKYTFTAQTHGLEGGTVRRHYYYAIPKYRLKRVSKLSESEVQEQ